MRLTRVQKYYLAALFPLYGTKGKKRQELIRHLKQWKRAARGRYWMDDEFEQFVAFTKSGRRKFIDYDSNDDADIARSRIEAKHWSARKF